MIRTWWARPSAIVDRDRQMSLLSATEQARMARYQRPADRDRFLAAWSLARTVLGELTNVAPNEVTVVRSCEHCPHETHGRPRLVHGDWHFSLSHAADRVLLAVSQVGQVGADVEPISNRIADIAPLVLHPDEPSAAGADLMRIWVRKEAVVKATGHGLAVAMTSFVVSPANQPARLLAWKDDPTLPDRTTMFDVTADDGYLASVAVITK